MPGVLAGAHREPYDAPTSPPERGTPLL